MFHPFQVNFGNSMSLSWCEVALNKCRVAEVFKILKCWNNGWATTRRYISNEERVLPCLLVVLRLRMTSPTTCSARTCCALDLFDRPFVCGGISEYPLERCGLVEPSNFKFCCMACCNAGHAVRREFGDRGTHCEHPQPVQRVPIRAVRTS